jgi:hypothetical protein
MGRRLTQEDVAVVLRCSESGGPQAGAQRAHARPGNQQLIARCQGPANCRRHGTVWSPNGLHPIANSKLLVAPQRLIPNRSPREPCTLRSALAPTGMQSP